MEENIEQNVLEEPLVSFAPFIVPDYLLMQDNARPHVAKEVLQYLRDSNSGLAQKKSIHQPKWSTFRAYEKVEFVEEIIEYAHVKKKDQLNGRQILQPKHVTFVVVCVPYDKF